MTFISFWSCCLLAVTLLGHYCFLHSGQAGSWGVLKWSPKELLSQLFMTSNSSERCCPGSSWFQKGAQFCLQFTYMSLNPIYYPQQFRAHGQQLFHRQQGSDVFFWGAMEQPNSLYPGTSTPFLKKLACCSHSETCLEHNTYHAFAVMPVQQAFAAYINEPFQKCSPCFLVLSYKHLV